MKILFRILYVAIFSSLSVYAQKTTDKELNKVLFFIKQKTYNFSLNKIESNALKKINNLSGS